MRDLFESVKQVISNDKTLGSVVANLNGVPDAPEAEETAHASQEWLLAEVEAKKVQSLQDVVGQFTFDLPSYETRLADDTGSIRYTPTGVKTSFLAYTIAKIPNPRAVPISARAVGQKLSLYIGGVLIGSGQDAIRFTPSLPAGPHQIIIVASGAATPISVSLDPAIECVVSDLIPSAPILSTDPEFFVLDPAKGRAIVRVSWLKDTFAAAWQVYRAEAHALTKSDGNAAPIGGTTIDVTSGLVTTTLPALHELELDSMLYTRQWTAGTVVDSTQNPGSGTTTVVIQPVLGAPTEAFKWDGMELYLPDELQSIGRLGLSGGGILRFDDAAVAQDHLYIYQVTAFGMLARAESALSLPAAVWTNDQRAPGPVVIDDIADPELGVTGVGSEITVTFRTPVDPDYAGVSVYGPYARESDNSFIPPVAFTDADRRLTDLGKPNSRDQLKFKVPDGTVDSVFYLATFDALGNEQEVQSYVDEFGDTIPAAVSFDYDGPFAGGGIDPLAAILLNIDDAASTSETHRVELTLVPGGDLTLEVWVNGVLLTGSTQTIAGVTYPAVVAGTSSTDGDVYLVDLARITTADTTRLVARASGTGYRPDTTAYVMDRDPYPGLSYTHVEDYRGQPQISAGMDDDARWLRLVKGGAPDTPAASDILHVVTRLTDAETGLTADVYDETELIWDRSTDFPAPLATEASESYRIDASRDGVNWWVGLWRGSIHGASASVITAAIKLSVVVAEPTHTLNFDVFPSDADVTVTQNGAAVALAHQTSGQYTLDVVRSDLADIQVVITASRTGVEATSITYSIDRNNLPGANVSAADRRNPATITATADDDAKRVRFVRNPSGTPLYYPAGASMTQSSLGTDCTTTKTQPRNVAFAAAEEEQEWAVEVSADATGATGWKRVWTQVLKGEPAVAEGIIPCTIKLEASSSASPTITLTVFPSDATVSATLNGTPFALTPGASGIYTCVLTPSSLTDQKLIVQAEAGGYSAGSATYAIDRDSTPGFSSISAPVPLYTGSVQDGWQINAAADDDARQVAVTCEGGISLREAVPALVSGAVDTSNVKSFTLKLNQAAGERGTISLLPKDGSTKGEMWSMELTSSPHTEITLSDVTSTLRRITLQTTPAASKIFVSAKKASGAKLNTYMPNAAGAPIRPGSTVQRSGDGPSLTVFIDLNDATTAGVVEDALIEYYAVSTAGSVPEAVQTRRIDKDKDPEVALSATGGGNQLDATVIPDDDVVLWRLWAKRSTTGEYPTTNGTKTGEPDNNYLYFEGGQHDRQVSWWAKEGSWYLVARAYDYAGKSTQTTTVQLVTVASSTAAALSNVAASRQDNTSGADYHIVTWGHNSAITSGSGHVVRVMENGVSAGSANAFSNTLSIVTPEQKLSGDANSVFRRFQYSVQLLDSSGGVLNSYPLIVEGYYDDGTVTQVAPSEVPGTPSISPVVDGTYMKAVWVNTSSAWEIEDEWLIGGDPGGGTPYTSHFLAPSSTTNTQRYQVGDVASVHIRYRNDAGPGPWSTTSNTSTVIAS